MKQCPQCHDVYPDEGLKFCGRDGSPLVDLSQAVGGFASLPVSPSEIVLLHGEQFAGPGDSTVVKVPTSGALVDAVQLARMILAAMVLGCEQAGSIRLQAGPTGGCLLVSEGPIRNVRWQEWSLEYRLCGIMGQGINRQLPHLIAQLWQRDFRAQLGEAWIHARTLVLQGLASRNLISAAPDFSNVGVAPALSTLPGEETTEPLKNLFSEVSAQRPNIWAALQRDFTTGINQRARRGGMAINI
jgi:hypothetical protein